MIRDDGRINALLTGTEQKIAEASRAAWKERNTAVSGEARAYVDTARYQARLDVLDTHQKDMEGIVALLESLLVSDMLGAGRRAGIDAAAALTRAAKASYRLQLNDAKSELARLGMDCDGRRSEAASLRNIAGQNDAALKRCRYQHSRRRGRNSFELPAVVIDGWSLDPFWRH